VKKCSEKWNLYWVVSDGIEDCFVVAKNSRSACAVEANMNGFEIEYATATKIMRIPKVVENSYRRQKEYRGRRWPGYVYGKTFFKSLGAQFRTIDDKEEMLLDDVVYEAEEYIPCSIHKHRTIGWRAVEELRKIPELHLEYDDEDIWPGPERHLMTMLGMCLVRCQQIEDYIARSFLLGISKKQKAQYETFNDLRKGWKKKTLGNMLRCMQEAWEIEPFVKANFELFLEHRNMLIHGITTDERFDIRTRWG
jgi:hypothetical protein